MLFLGLFYSCFVTSNTITFSKGWEPSEACSLFSDKGILASNYAALEETPDKFSCQSKPTPISKKTPSAAETPPTEDTIHNTITYQVIGNSEKAKELIIRTHLMNVQETETAIANTIIYARDLYFRATGRELNILVEVRIARGFDGTWTIGRKKQRKILFRRTALNDNEGFILTFKLEATSPSKSPSKSQPHRS